MQILAMGVRSRRPMLVEFTDAEMVLWTDYQREFERTDNIVLSAKVALRRHAKRGHALTDEIVDYFSDGMLQRFGRWQTRVKGGVSTSAIGASTSTRKGH